MKNRSTFVVASILALSSHGCSHAISAGLGVDPTVAAQAQAQEAPSGAPAAQPIAVYRVPLDGLPSMGNADALVTIVEFTDYECPYCQRAEKTIAQVRTTYGDSVRVVVAELPLPFHSRARPAALAALAADAQGKFEPMHQHLFALAGSLSDGAIAGAAQGAGLDMARFDADRAAAPLGPSEQLAKRLGVNGTPTFFIDGRHVVGAQTFETFRDVIDERLAAARSLVTGGTRARDVYAALTAGGADHVAEEPKDDGAGCGDKNCNDGPDDEPATGDKVEAVPIDGAPARGPANASITIVSFGDFECPFSAKAEATLRAVEQAHPGDVRVIFKNQPLPMHSYARPAAIAAMAADAQGHFWEFHDQLYAHANQGGGTLDRAAFEKIAAGIGLDAARFAHDLDDPKIAALVAHDQADAETLEVKGTPTFFVNGRRVVGAQPAAVFETVIAKGTKR
jgi:protein-disulfide isomerase